MIRRYYDPQNVMSLDWIFSNFIDDRYQVVPKPEYKKELLENELNQLERNAKTLTNSLTETNERIEQIKKELKE